MDGGKDAPNARSARTPQIYRNYINSQQICVLLLHVLFPETCRACLAQSGSVSFHLLPLLFPPGMSARDVAQALKSLASAARGVAASTEDPATRNAVLDCAGDVMDKSANLIEETKRAIAKPGDAESQQRLAQVRHTASARKAFLDFYYGVNLKIK